MMRTMNGGTHVQLILQCPDLTSVRYAVAIAIGSSIMPWSEKFFRVREKLTAQELVLSIDDFELLIFALGVAAGSVGPERADAFIRLADRVNRGNPNWTPYFEERLKP
jgi:hypothetical protein